VETAAAARRAAAELNAHQVSAQIRVRLGASVDTPGDILALLAHSSDVTVRAAVAMNPSAPATADQILRADPDERVRALLARRLAVRLAQLTAAEAEAVSTHLHDSLAALVADEAQRVRSAIAEAVKDMAGIPRELILRLASDTAIEVSEPVIRLSPLLTTEDLLALISAPPNAAAVSAVARRPSVVEQVSDAIAATADTDAIRHLLANPMAAIREATLDSLIARAADHDDWHEPLVRRPALPPAASSALSHFVATNLLEALSRRADLDATTQAELANRLAARLRAAPSLPATHAAGDRAISTDEAMAEARALELAGRLSEASLVAALRRGDVQRASRHPCRRGRRQLRGRRPGQRPAQRERAREPALGGRLLDGGRRPGAIRRRPPAAWRSARRGTQRRLSPRGRRDALANRLSQPGHALMACGDRAMLRRAGYHGIVTAG